jgi:hypothetical protein
MFKQCTALFLLLAFVAMTFSRAVIVVDFYVNQENIARTLCENRNKPMMHCCGRCQLHRRLAKEDNQDKNSPERKSDNRDEVLFCQKNTPAFIAPFRDAGKVSYSSFAAGAPVDRSFSFFHPPAGRV